MSAIAWSWLEEGDLASAEEIGKEAVAQARAHQARIREADAFNVLGEIARRRENWNKAVRLYERCQQLWREAGSRYAILVEINVALAHAGAGRWSNARSVYRRLGEALPANGFETRLVHVHIGLASCAADRGDWEAWDEHMEALDEELEAHDFRITDFPWVAQRGARVCLEAGNDEAAERMYRVARRLWRDVGLDEEVARLDERLDAL